MALCAVAAVVASFLFLADFGRATGYPGPTAYLLPLVTDALAVAAWRVGNVPVGLLATGASIAGNAAGHALATGDLTWAVAVTGGWPVVALALIVHLSSPARRTVDVEVTEDPDVDTANPWVGDPWIPAPPAVPAPAPTVVPVAPSVTPAPDPVWKLLDQHHAPPAPTATAAPTDEDEAPDFTAMTDDQIASWATRAGKTSYRDLWKAGVRPDRRARAINSLIRNGVLA